MSYPRPTAKDGAQLSQHPSLRFPADSCAGPSAAGSAQSSPATPGPQDLCCLCSPEARSLKITPVRIPTSELVGWVPTATGKYRARKAGLQSRCISCSSSSSSRQLWGLQKKGKCPCVFLQVMPLVLQQPRLAVLFSAVP